MASICQAESAHFMVRAVPWIFRARRRAIVHKRRLEPHTTKIAELATGAIFWEVVGPNQALSGRLKFDGAPAGHRMVACWGNPGAAHVGQPLEPLNRPGKDDFEHIYHGGRVLAATHLPGGVHGQLGSTHIDGRDAQTGCGDGADG